MTIARLNTQIAYIPLLSSYAGQNVLNSLSWDKQFVVRANFVGETQQDKDIGIPGPIYGENILPTTIGWETANYVQKIRPSDQNYKFNQLINLKSGTDTNVLFSPGQGRNLLNINGVWGSTTYAGNFSGMVTSAYVKLKGLVFYQRQKLFSYNSATGVTEEVFLDGLNLSNIDGIAAANNYLIAWNETTIFWSSNTDPLDFKPSLSSGAGSQNPTQVRGKIIACLPMAGGFIIYTTLNAISATWSGNIRYPWSFNEIPGSSGIRDPEHVSYESNYDGHYAWTVNGLELVTKSGSRPIYPELTDFFTGKLVEEYIGPTQYQAQVNTVPDFNSATQAELENIPGPNLLQKIRLVEEPWVKVTLVGSRFVVISYGYRDKGQYDWAIVYDIALKRFGKLKFRHTDCFNYLPQTLGENQTKEVIGFLRADGAIYIIDPSLYGEGHGVLIYGRLKDRQGQWIDLEGVKMQSLRRETPNLFVYPSFSGSRIEQPIIPFLAEDSGEVKEWYCRAGGDSMNLVFSGQFSMSSLLVEYNIGGSR